MSLLAPALVGAALVDDEGFQCGQPIGPELAVELQPLRRFRHRPGVEREQVFAPAHRARDQARAFEHADVLGGGIERDGERAGDLGHPRIRLRQPCQDRPPGAVGHGREQCIEASVVIFIHTGEYMSATRRGQAALTVRPSWRARCDPAGWRDVCRRPSRDTEHRWSMMRFCNRGELSMNVKLSLLAAACALALAACSDNSSSPTSSGMATPATTAPTAAAEAPVTMAPAPAATTAAAPAMDNGK